MEQLQGLLAHIAVGLQRLEADLSSEQPEEACAEERARRTTLRIATAANRCSWCSVCELACYMTTGALARKTHIPIAISYIQLSQQLDVYAQTNTDNLY